MVCLNCLWTWHERDRQTKRHGMAGLKKGWISRRVVAGVEGGAGTRAEQVQLKQGLSRSATLPEAGEVAGYNLQCICWQY